MAVLVRRLTSGEAETLVGRSVAAKKVEEVVENGTRFAEVAVAKKANRDGAAVIVSICGTIVTGS